MNRNRLYKYLALPFISWFIVLLSAGVLGKDLLIQYAIGHEKVLVEEYLIILCIVVVITVVIDIKTLYKNSTK